MSALNLERTIRKILEKRSRITELDNQEVLVYLAGLLQEIATKPPRRIVGELMDLNYRNVDELRNDINQLMFRLVSA
jgi:hypothetical protein